MKAKNARRIYENLHNANTSLERALSAIDRALETEECIFCVDTTAIEQLQATIAQFMSIVDEKRDPQ